MRGKQFDTDFDWQQSLLTEVKKCIAPYLLHEASPEEDMKRNTDLMIDPATRVSSRIRSYEDLHKYDYANEFTIRCDRRSGFETELSKLIAGFGTHGFYGFADAAGTGLAAWFLGDWNIFRKWFNYEIAKNKGQIPGVLKQNKDGSSAFRVFKIAEPPPEFVIARVTADMGQIAQRTIEMSISSETATGGQWSEEDQKMWGL
jgi:hypothetical protein